MRRHAEHGRGCVMATAWILEGHTRGYCNCQPHAHGLVGCFSDEAAATEEGEKIVALFAEREGMWLDVPHGSEAEKANEREVDEWLTAQGYEYVYERFRVIEVPVMAPDHPRGNGFQDHG